MRPEPGTPRPNAVLRVSVLCSPCTELLTSTTCSSRSTALTTSVVVDLVSSLTTSGNACFIHANALAPFGEAGKLRTPLPALVFAEDSIHTAQRETAESKGAEFVDIREATRGHGLCAPDPERYVSGYIDDQQEYYTASHLTHTGVREVAKIIAERF